MSPPHHYKARFFDGTSNDGVPLQRRGIIGWVMEMWKSTRCIIPGEERLQSTVDFESAATLEESGTGFSGVFATWKLIFFRAVKLDI